MEPVPESRGNYNFNYPPRYVNESPSLRRQLMLLIIGWVGITEIGDTISEWVAKYAPNLENLTVERSAADCMKILNGLTIEDAGEFFNYDGTKLPF